MPINKFSDIWDANVVIKPGTVYGTSDPEFVGVMPIRQEIEVLPADEPIKIEMHGWIVIDDHDDMHIKNPSNQLKLGWVVSETIGVGVVNTRGVSAGRKTAIVGNK